MTDTCDLRSGDRVMQGLCFVAMQSHMQAPSKLFVRLRSSGPTKKYGSLFFRGFGSGFRVASTFYRRPFPNPNPPRLMELTPPAPKPKS